MLPELGHIGPFTIRTYTLLLDLAILVGLAALARQGWRVDDKPLRWLDAGLWALAGGIVGGRLAHVFVHWAYFSEHPGEILQIWNGGLDWHGAVIGGLLALAAGCRIRRVSFQQASDVLSLVLPFGAALTYTGCLMNRCGHGREVETLAGYPPLIVAELPDLYGVPAPRLASQLYGIVLSVCLLAVAFVLARRLRRPGLRLWIGLALLGLGVFGIGFTRGDAIPMVGSLRLDQILDLGIAAVGIAGTLIVARQPRPSGAATLEER